MECKMKNKKPNTKPRYAEDILTEKWGHFPMRIFHYQKPKKVKRKSNILYLTNTPNYNANN